MFPKLVGKVNFWERKFEEMEVQYFEKQKGTRYIWENVYFSIIIFICLLSKKLKLHPIFLINCFVWEIKVFYQSSLA